MSEDGGLQPEQEAPVIKHEDYEGSSSDVGSDESVSSSTTIRCPLTSEDEAIADNIGGGAHGLTNVLSPIRANCSEAAVADID